jgi:hypothetical protein
MSVWEMVPILSCTLLRYCRTHVLRTWKALQDFRTELGTEVGEGKCLGRDGRAGT